jgi:hypothetical protein
MRMAVVCTCGAYVRTNLRLLVFFEQGFQTRKYLHIRIFTVSISVCATNSLQSACAPQINCNQRVCHKFIVAKACVPQPQIHSFNQHVCCNYAFHCCNQHVCCNYAFRCCNQHVCCKYSVIWLSGFSLSMIDSACMHVGMSHGRKTAYIC